MRLLDVLNIEYQHFLIQINENIQQNTGGHITDLLLEDDVDALTQLVLLNAIYFKGRVVIILFKTLVLLQI